jgi:hypothetical protein
MGIISWFTARFDSSARSPEEPGWVRRWVLPGPGRPDPKVERIKRAAEDDVEAMEEEDRRYFRQDGPGHIEDDL